MSRKKIFGVALAVCGVGVLAVLLVPTVDNVRSISRYDSALFDEEYAPSSAASVAQDFEDEPAMADDFFINEGADGEVRERAFGRIESPAGQRQPVDAKDSQESLSEIQRSLEPAPAAPSLYFKEDDVPYVPPAPANGPPSDRGSKRGSGVVETFDSGAVNAAPYSVVRPEPQKRTESYTVQVPESERGQSRSSAVKRSSRPSISSWMYREETAPENEASDRFGVTLSVPDFVESSGTEPKFDDAILGNELQRSISGEAVWGDFAVGGMAGGKMGGGGMGGGDTASGGTEVRETASGKASLEFRALGEVQLKRHDQTFQKQSEEENEIKLLEKLDGNRDGTLPHNLPEKGMVRAEVRQSVPEENVAVWADISPPGAIPRHRLPQQPGRVSQDREQLPRIQTLDEIDENRSIRKNSKFIAKEPAKKVPFAGRAILPSLGEIDAAKEAFSTFSLHVSDVSFKLAQSSLAAGKWPESTKVRIEEFVNAFDYGDPMPRHDEKVSCRLEQSIHPFLQQRNLLRVSMRTAAAGRASSTPLRLTFLLDNSGSMERPDRRQTVRRAFALLAAQLKPIDQVTLISFARKPRLLADRVSGANSAQLIQLIDELPSEGGTNMELALALAFEKAREQQVAGAQNRIVLLTDGAVNLGEANPESLSQMIIDMRDAGIAFDAAGIDADGLNDEVLEALTRKGDGRYYLLDSVESADEGFSRQIAGALRPSAKNVKVQIEFNPDRVGSYRLLGFEKHTLKKEDFRNDKVDAAEMAAAEAGVAVYQFEAKPDGQGDVGSVSVRFRDLSTGEMVENRWPIPYQADAPRVEHAAPSMRIVTSAALFAAKLRGDLLGDSVDLKTLSELLAGLPERDRAARRVGQLQQMIEQARQIGGQ